MILADFEIKAMRLVDPHIEKRAHLGLTGGCGGNSYDVHFGRQWGIPKSGPAIDLTDGVPGDMFQYVEQDEFELPPLGFALATTMETIDLPANIAVGVVGKSTWVRVGMSADTTWCDPGFKGNVTLELFNKLNRPLILRAGQPAVQLVCYFATPARAPYNGRYQGQRGIVGPMAAGG